MISVIIESAGTIGAKSPNDIIGIVGIAGKGDGTPRLIDSLTEAIAIYGEPLNSARKAGKTIANYGLVDAIATIYQYAQAPIIAINGWNGTSVTAVPEKSYTLVSGKALLDDVNVISPVVKSSDGTTTYVNNTDYIADLGKGIITRKEGGAIASPTATLKIAYSIPDFAAVSWATLISSLNVEIEGKKPTLILTSGVVTTQQIAAALETTAKSMGAIALYTQPGTSASTTTQLTQSRNAIAVFPGRTRNLGVEESSAHLAGIIASKNYWENPLGTIVQGNSDPAIALSQSDASTLLAKGIVWVSDRIQGSLTTSNDPLATVRLQIKAEAIAKQITPPWIGKPRDLLHIEGLGQALRDRLSQEPTDSLLSMAKVNFNAAQSNLSAGKLAYTIYVGGTSGSDRRITEIVIYLA